jgi:hypothetical protein
MNRSPDQHKMTDHLKNLARWIVLVPVVLLVLFGCGQFALVSAQSPGVQGPLTKMQADYRAWDFTEFKPVAEGIMDEILKDRSRYAYGAPPSIVLSSGAVWPTQQAEQQQTPATSVPTVQTSPTPPATLLPQPTATVAVTPSATKVLWIPYTATNIPPQDTETPIPTSTSQATSTSTATATAIATSTATATPTATATATAVPSGMNIGSPDGAILNLGGGGEWIIDLEAETGNPLRTSPPDTAYDLVVYEYEVSPGIIMLDHIIVEVGTGPSGSCSSSTWMTVLNWGDTDPNNNGQLGNLFPGELDNQSIPFVHLYNGSTAGIGIDINALSTPGFYPCLRIYSPVSGDGDAAQVDSIEILP